MRVDLFTHPKVVRISSACNADKLRTIGGLHSAWCLFDVHTTDGRLDGYTPKTLDDYLGLPGFAQAMIDVGWLEFVDSSALVMPRFSDHNGNSAKRRALEADRKRSVRKASASDADNCPHDGGTNNGQNADQSKRKSKSNNTKKKNESEPHPENISFPTVGDPDKPEWKLPNDLVEIWVRTYPALDIIAEVRAAYAWIISNPTDRKTNNGMSRFLNGWLKRAQDNPRMRAKRSQNTNTGKPSFSEMMDEKLKDLGIE